LDLLLPVLAFDHLRFGFAMNNTSPHSATISYLNY